MLPSLFRFPVASAPATGTIGALTGNRCVIFLGSLVKTACCSVCWLCSLWVQRPRVCVLILFVTAIFYKCYEWWAIKHTFFFFFLMSYSTVQDHFWSRWMFKEHEWHQRKPVHKGTVNHPSVWDSRINFILWADFYVIVSYKSSSTLEHHTQFWCGLKPMLFSPPVHW